MLQHLNPSSPLLLGQFLSISLLFTLSCSNPESSITITTKTVEIRELPYQVLPLNDLSPFKETLEKLANRRRCDGE